MEVDAPGSRLAFSPADGSAWSIQGLDRDASVRYSGVAPASEEYDVGTVRGRSYDTVVANYRSTASFIWAYSLSSIVHALPGTG